MGADVWQGLIEKRLAHHFNQFHTSRTDRMGRRGFLRTTGAAAGLSLASGLPRPQMASGQVTEPEPKPIPGGAVPLGILVHHYPLPSTPVPLIQINEPSEITDFNGFIGDTQIRGAGMGTSSSDTLAYRADMGFMQGVYVGEDGKHHHGTFVFI